MCVGCKIEIEIEREFQVLAILEIFVTSNHEGMSFIYRKTASQVGNIYIGTAGAKYLCSSQGAGRLEVWVAGHRKFASRPDFKRAYLLYPDSILGHS